MWLLMAHLVLFFCGSGCWWLMWGDLRKRKPFGMTKEEWEWVSAGATLVIGVLGWLAVILGNIHGFERWLWTMLLIIGVIGWFINRRNKKPKIDKALGRVKDVGHKLVVVNEPEAEGT
jgi:hypothetical protein